MNILLAFACFLLVCTEKDKESSDQQLPSCQDTFAEDVIKEEQCRCGAVNCSRNQFCLAARDKCATEPCKPFFEKTFLNEAVAIFNWK